MSRPIRDFFKVHQGQPKKRFTPAEMDAFNRHGWFCHYCAATHPLTTDHITARANGGGEGADNLVPCCLACNTSKGKRDYETFKEHVCAELAAFEAMHIGEA